MEVLEVALQGSPVCQGIACGKLYLFNRKEDIIPDASVDADQIENEILAYRKALDLTRRELLALKRVLERENAIDGVDILETHLQLTQDPLFTIKIEDGIRCTHKSAPTVFYQAIQECKKRFNSIKDHFFRERFKDVQDLAERILSHLKAKTRTSLKEIPPDSVIFAESLTASDAAEIDTSTIAGVVCFGGGAASHAVIVAKARGIPYVMHVPIDLEELHAVQDVALNGSTGEIILNPTGETLKRFRAQKSALEEQFRQIVERGKAKAETYDGYTIKLSANIDKGDELHLLHAYGGSGVGLFRSEFQFLSHKVFPSEAEQYRIYRSTFKKMLGLPIVIRTFDLGGDKYAEWGKGEKEANPFLGCRAIRFLLKERDLFKMQLRAILRAGVDVKLSIMFPLVSSLNELLEAKEVLKEVERELELEGRPFNPSVKVGCMIEVPSAALIADLLAKECDFLSIGTNDLVQYALAVDRDNRALTGLYSPSDPSIIRLIRLVVAEANAAGIPVSVCGEMAGDTFYTPLLIGLGIQELSVTARYLPFVREAIRKISVVDAHLLAQKVLEAKTPAEVTACLTAFNA